VSMCEHVNTLDMQACNLSACLYFVCVPECVCVCVCLCECVCVCCMHAQTLPALVFACAHALPVCL